MVCSSCGAEIAGNTKFCGYCGMPINQSETPELPPVEESPIIEPSKAQISLSTPVESVEPPAPNPTPINFVVEEDSASITVKGTKIEIAPIIKVIAIVLSILFFFPLFTVSCQGTEIEFSGLSATFGKTISTFGSNEKIEGNIIAIFLFLIPVILFAIFQFKKNLKFINGKLFLASSLLSVLPRPDEKDARRFGLALKPFAIFVSIS